MPISFDYDGTLSTKKGKDLAAKFISEGKDVRILTARDSNGDNTDLESTAKELLEIYKKENDYTIKQERLMVEIISWILKIVIILIIILIITL